MKNHITFGQIKNVDLWVGGSTDAEPCAAEPTTGNLEYI